MPVHPTDLAFHPHGDERLSLKPRSRDAAGDFASLTCLANAPDGVVSCSRRTSRLWMDTGNNVSWFRLYGRLVVHQKSLLCWTLHFAKCPRCCLSRSSTHRALALSLAIASRAQALT